MPGRALEVALTSDDIRASFEWWTRLGFSNATTGDTWTHPYGVLAVPGLNLALHGVAFEGPVLTLVRPELAAYARLLKERGVATGAAQLGPEAFNELRFSDPSGLPVRILEARTFSPVPDAAHALPGHFEAVSWPAQDAEAVAEFWGRLQVPCRAVDDDWADLRADIGGQSVAWHAPRLAREPLLVFRHASPEWLRAALASAGIRVATRGPSVPGPHLSLVSPEGLRLLILA